MTHPDDGTFGSWWPAALGRLREWLVRHNRIMMAALFAVLALALAAQGINALR